MAMKYPWHKDTFQRLPLDLPTHGSASPTRKKFTRLILLGGLIAVGVFTLLGAVAFSQIKLGHEDQSPVAPFFRLRAPTEMRPFTPSAAYLDGLPWMADMPDGGGYVTSQGKLEPDTNDTYVVSMWHQVHCLAYINNALFPGGKATCRDFDDVENSLHLRHCIEYISKAILCAADTTLERATVTGLEDGRHNYFVGEASAWETSHKCRSLEPISDLVAKYSVSRYAKYA